MSIISRLNIVLGVIIGMLCFLALANLCIYSPQSHWVHMLFRVKVRLLAYVGYLALILMSEALLARKCLWRYADVSKGVVSGGLIGLALQVIVLAQWNVEPTPVE